MISEKTLNTLLAAGVVVALVVLGIAIFSPPAQPAMQSAVSVQERSDAVPASAGLSIVSKANVNVVMSSTPAHSSVVLPGSYITYTIVVSNTSAEELPSYEVTALIPNGTYFDSYTTSQAATTAATTVTWKLVNLAGGSSVTLGYRLRVGNLTYANRREIIHNFATVYIAPPSTSAENTINSDMISHVVEQYEK